MHSLAMEISTGRVWDYIAGMFVCMHVRMTAYHMSLRPDAYVQHLETTSASCKATGTGDGKGEAASVSAHFA